MSILPAVIGLAGTVLGIGAQRSAANRAYKEQDPATIRRKYENAGFNPLLGIGAPVQPVMSGIGQTIASGFSDFANNLLRDKELQLKAQEVEAENKRLEKIAAKAVLTPKVAGAISSGRNTQSPMYRGSNDQSNFDTWMRPSASTGDSVGVSSTLTGYPTNIGSVGEAFDSRRETEVAPNQSISGVTEINNEWLNEADIGPLPVLGSDGEPWGLGELIGVGISGAGIAGYRKYQEARGSLARKFADRRFKKMYEDYYDAKAVKAMRPRVSATVSQIDAWRMRQAVMGN